MHPGDWCTVHNVLRRRRGASNVRGHGTTQTRTICCTLHGRSFLKIDATRIQVRAVRARTGKRLEAVPPSAVARGYTFTLRRGVTCRTEL